MNTEGRTKIGPPIVTPATMMHPIIEIIIIIEMLTWPRSYDQQSHDPRLLSQQSDIVNQITTHHALSSAPNRLADWARELVLHVSNTYHQGASNAKSRRVSMHQCGNCLQIKWFKRCYAEDMAHKVVARVGLLTGGASWQSLSVVLISVHASTTNPRGSVHLWVDISTLGTQYRI